MNNKLKNNIKIILIGIFAIVILVIILLSSMFFLPIFLQIIFPTGDTFCYERTDKPVSTFKLLIEDSVNLKNTNQFFFELPTDCYKEANKIIKIEKFTSNPRLCAAICGMAVDSCYALLFAIPTTVVFKQKCLNIPKYTEFYNTPELCTDANLINQGFEIKSIENLNSSGEINIQNVSKQEDVYPKICIYQKL